MPGPVDVHLVGLRPHAVRFQMLFPAYYIPIPAPTNSRSQSQVLRCAGRRVESGPHPRSHQATSIVNPTCCHKTPKIVKLDGTLTRRPDNLHNAWMRVYVYVCACMCLHVSNMSIYYYTYADTYMHLHTHTSTYMHRRTENTDVDVHA